MNPVLPRLPLCITLALVAVLVLLGPIAQPAAYHAFADDTPVMGIPRAADVLSNLGFAVVALWAFHRLRPHRGHPALALGWPGYRLFLLGLLGTAAGSAFYHWAPDDARLVWDRLPIALACGGLLAAVASETRHEADGRPRAALLALAAVLSVAWWVWTGARGQGDLRPYLLLQAAPLVLVPVWQA
ncbi:MAG: hypothetical protein JNM82_09015, partial [Rhodocyclaceae bacterium]|nr:hypothetical protein [Rhodocyclaceae bacterium]